MSVVLGFWLASLVVGALALPLSFRLLRRFPDGGAGLSFALGLTLTGWGYFWLRTLDVLPPGRGAAVLALALFAIFSAGVAGHDRRFLTTCRYAWPGIAAVAGVFTLFFFSFVAFRSYTPEIGGTEQPMDLLYLNASTESVDYPPNDPWLAGERASYYYFGYLQVGILTDISGASPGSGYNLGLAYTFAAAAACVASLAFVAARWALGWRRRGWAFAAPVTGIVLLLFVGSLAGTLELAAAHGWGDDGLYERLGVTWLKPCDPGQVELCRPESDRWYPTRFFFWFEESRVIRSDPEAIPPDYDTITEFPAFSFILGDLHPHVMSIPLVLLVLGLTASTWRGRGALDFGTHRRDPLPGIAVALILGALAFQNAWDLPTFSALFGLAVIVRNLRARPAVDGLVASVWYLAPMGLLAFATYLPWYSDFRSQAEGLYPYVGEGSHPGQAFLQFGPLFACGLLVSAFVLRGQDLRAAVDLSLYAAWAPLAPLLLWVGLAQYHGQLDDAVDARGQGGWITLFVYAVGAWWLATVALVLAVARRPSAVIVALAAAGALLLLGAELFLIKDVFYGNVPRLNTVFKLTYQAWLLLSVAGAVALTVAVERLTRRRPAGWLAAPALGLVALGLVYVLIALPNRTEGFSGETEVDGLAFLARADPSEYALTRWVQENVASDEVVFEATGRRWGPGQDGRATLLDPNVDYSDAGRIAARTGRQTPIGWFFHEVQWRGDSEANQRAFRTRQDMVDLAYTTDDGATVLGAMQSFGARYLVVGAVEQRQYGELLPDFESFLEPVFVAGAYRVYRVHGTKTVQTS